MRRIIFFDHQCSLCRASISWVMQKDPHKLFLFAPLKGKSAQKLLPEQMQKKDSLVLLEEVEGKKILLWEATAVFKILWILGGKYRLLGWLYYMPGFLTNPCYRLIARRRNHFFAAVSVSTWDESRLLP